MLFCIQIVKNLIFIISSIKIMAVKIRLARRGRKKLALYDIVVANAKSPRDGRFIEKLGTYNPNTNPSTVYLNEEGALQWLLNGAQPTDTVRSLLSSKGVLLKKYLQVGVKKNAITQDVADQKLITWKAQKQANLDKKIQKKNISKVNTTQKSPTEKAKIKKTADKPVNTQPPAANIKLPTTDIKLPTTDIKPPTTDIKPLTTDIKPLTTDIKPPAADIKPPAASTKPATTDIKQAHKDQNPKERK